MPLESQSSKSSKGKRIKSFGRVSSSADPDYPLPYNRVDDGEIILPLAFRVAGPEYNINVRVVLCLKDVPNFCPTL
ncbi:hypothetical protein TNCV_1225191 [Trichonephila clavipes]|nr:hypothetical protein TNCV_1225191 [Trichonephila clavipes]